MDSELPPMIDVELISTEGARDSLIYIIKRYPFSVQQLKALSGINGRALQGWKTAEDLPVTDAGRPVDAERLSYLFAILETLEAEFTSEESVYWFSMRHPQLDYQRPITVIEGDSQRYAEVLGAAVGSVASIRSVH